MLTEQTFSDLKNPWHYFDDSGKESNSTCGFCLDDIGHKRKTEAGCDCKYAYCEPCWRSYEKHKKDNFGLGPTGLVEVKCPTCTADVVYAPTFEWEQHPDDESNRIGRWVRPRRD